jgi:hypothetical protein
MSDKRRHALRYFLLRYLWSARERVPVELYREISESLTVDEGDDGFTVRWTRGGSGFSRFFRKSDFRLFARSSEGGNGKDLVEAHHTVRRLGREFAEYALGVERLIGADREEPFFSQTLFHLILYATCAVILLVTGGSELAPAALLMLGLFAVEFWHPSGKTLTIPLVVLFIPAGFHFIGMITAASYSLLHFLDPDDRRRSLRVVMSVSALAYAVISVEAHDIQPSYSHWILPMAFAAGASFVASWVVGTHFRMMPLIFPFACIGFFLDGYSYQALVIISFAVLFALFEHKGYLVFPVQKDGCVGIKDPQ